MTIVKPRLRKDESERIEAQEIANKKAVALAKIDSLESSSKTKQRWRNKYQKACEQEANLMERIRLRKADAAKAKGLPEPDFSGAPMEIAPVAAVEQPENPLANLSDERLQENLAKRLFLLRLVPTPNQEAVATDLIASHQAEMRRRNWMELRVAGVEETGVGLLVDSRGRHMGSDAGNRLIDTHGSTIPTAKPYFVFGTMPVNELESCNRSACACQRILNHRNAGTRE
jgi:hypothetical protein